jgi:hypothetical protein
MQSDMKFEGKLDAVHIRGDKQIKKRKNLGVSWFERLRGKLTSREGVAR